MKTKLTALLLLFALPFASFSQDENTDTLTATIQGEAFNTAPRKIELGRFVYYTGNISKPETMLRVWIADFSGSPSDKNGKYLIIDNENPPSNKKLEKQMITEEYVGYASVRYVVETKSPRMEYHVGDSGNNGETLVLNKAEDGTLTITFDATLNGTYWKEKASATVFGGLGRLQDKLEAKVITKATGYDWNIDPEGNGYRKQNDTDKIEITSAKMIFE